MTLSASGDDLLLGLPDELAEVVRLRYGLGAPDAAADDAQ